MGESVFRRAGPLATAFVAGLTGTVGQVLIMRELLVLFDGNELSSGLFFGSWLVWTAAGAGAAGFWLRARTPSQNAAALILLSGGLSLPLSLLLIRGFRIIWSLPVGETVSLPLMALICFLGTFPLCMSLGALFSIVWAGYADQSSRHPVRTSSIRIYTFEGLGAALGGVLFYFLLLPHLQSLSSTFAIAALLITLAVAHVAFEKWPDGGPLPVAVTGCVVAAFLASVLWFSHDLNAASRKWQWGNRVVTVMDTPYHNLALLEQAGLYSLFGNGVWYFSAPDPQVAELATHPVLLYHQRPRSVLLIGGGVSGIVAEALKHPDVASVEYVEPDPQLIALAKTRFPDDLVSTLSDKRVRVIHEDAGSFIKGEGRAYDVILMSVGEPINLELNRFYTVEFFQSLKRRLTFGGIFSFALPAPPEMVGQAQGRLLRSLDRTLKAVFPEVRLLMGGEGARFLACVSPNGLNSDAAELIRRARARALELNYLNDAAMMDHFSPLRARYADAFLRQGPTLPPNEDFRPVCALQSLLVWSARIHPALQPVFLSLTSKGSGWLWGGVSCLIGVIAVLACAGGHRRSVTPAVGLAVLLMGGAQMMLQLTLVFGFQIVRGQVYTELALIVSSFMVGIALGAGLSERLTKRAHRPRFWLALVQAMFMLHFGASLLFLILFHSDLALDSAMPMTVVLPAMALIAGTLGGLHFAFAVLTMTGGSAEEPGAWLGGGLYALDLVGAAVGALAASLILLPVYGLFATCLVPLALLSGSLGLLIVV